MPKIPGYIRRACTTRNTKVNVGKDGADYTTTRKVVDTECVSKMMSMHSK